MSIPQRTEPHLPPIVFSVVVPTWNRPAQLRGLLEALANQDFPAGRFEVVIVDDGGFNSLDPIVSPFRDRLDIRLLVQENQGCAGARQSGIDQAKGIYLAFTDDDCRPAPDWLSRLHGTLIREKCAAVGGITVNALRQNFYAEATQIIVDRLVTAQQDAGHGKTVRIRYCPTSNAAFPARAFRDIGGFDRDWRIAGGEDRDLCARWIRAGLELHFDPQAVVHHRHALTFAGFMRQHFNYGRGSWKFHHRAAPYRTRSYANLGFFTNLFVFPFRTQPFAKAVALAALLMAAQVSAAAGMLLELARGSVENR